MCEKSFEAVMGRLQSALGLSSNTALAERLGIGRGAFQQRKSRESIPVAEIDELCVAAKLNPEWVYEGKGEMRTGSWPGALKAVQDVQRLVGTLGLDGADARQVGEFLQYANIGDKARLLPLVRKLGYVSVPRYELSAAAGDGQVVYARDDQVVDSLAFRPEWLREIGVSPSSLAVISVRGDSMAETLSDGDLVMIDTTPNDRRMPGIYVIAKGDQLLIKRLHFKVSGGVEVRSDNKAYPNESLSAADFSEVRIVGRMVRRLVR